MFVNDDFKGVIFREMIGKRTQTTLNKWVTKVRQNWGLLLRMGASLSAPSVWLYLHSPPPQASPTPPPPPPPKLCPPHQLTPSFVALPTCWRTTRKRPPTATGGIVRTRSTCMHSCSFTPNVGICWHRGVTINNLINEACRSSLIYAASQQLM